MSSSDSIIPQQDQILERVKQLFTTCGVRSLSMDDLAQDLGVSKKTLYKYFVSKKDLVEQSMLRHVSEEECSLEVITGQAENAIDEMLLITRHVTALFATLNPALIYETRKYYPESWAIFEQYKSRSIYQRILHNLRQGIEQGLYRPEIEAEVIAKIYISKMDLFFDTQLFPPDKYRTSDIYREFMNYHIRGIASRKGVNDLEKRINPQQEHGT